MPVMPPRMTRRSFLVGSGVTGAVALAGGATALAWHDIVGGTQNSPAAGSSDRVLVLVTLYGGNDGLGTVVPAGDKAYQSARPDLAYAPGDVLDLGDGLGLNPAMTGLKSLWDRKRLAVVRGVSYPKPDHSHFRSMSIWQTASPATPVTTGWLGRWLDHQRPDPLRAISLGPTLPPLLAGATTAGSALSSGGLGTTPEGLRTGLDLLARGQAGELAHVARARGSVADLLTLEAKVRPVLAPGAGPSPSPSPTSSAGANDEAVAAGSTAGGQSQLAAQLDIVRLCIAARLPTRVYSVSLGGFDTHSNEKGTQSRLLGQLDAAVSGFLAASPTTPAGADVVVAVYSEFGRRVAANANEGTDHGTAGPVFVAGNGVRGGFHGDQPTLTDLDDGDLKATTDFRAVYASLLGDVLGSDPGQVLGGYDTRLPLIA